MRAPISALLLLIVAAAGAAQDVSPPGVFAFGRGQLQVRGVQWPDVATVAAIPAHLDGKDVADVVFVTSEGEALVVQSHTRWTEMFRAPLGLTTGVAVRLGNSTRDSIIAPTAAGLSGVTIASDRPSLARYQAPLSFQPGGSDYRAERGQFAFRGDLDGDGRVDVGFWYPSLRGFAAFLIDAEGARVRTTGVDGLSRAQAASVAVDGETRWLAVAGAMSERGRVVLVPFRADAFDGASSVVLDLPTVAGGAIGAAGGEGVLDVAGTTQGRAPGVVVTANGTSGSISIITGLGATARVAHYLFTTPYLEGVSKVLSVDLVDADLDGVEDLHVLVRGPAVEGDGEECEILLLRGYGNGRYSPEALIRLIDLQDSMVTGDLDANGIPDYALNGATFRIAFR